MTSSTPAPGFPPAAVAGLEGRRVQGQVSHVEPPAFWLQRDPAAVHAMSALLSRGSVSQDEAGEVEPGSAVAAYWEDDWYRATVRRVGDRGATVFFVDYGNTALVAPSCLRLLVPEELVAAPLALHCQLRGRHLAVWAAGLPAARYQADLYCERRLLTGALLLTALDPVREEPHVARPEPVLVTHVETPALVWVVPFARQQELDCMMKKLARAAGRLRPVAHLEEGGLLAAMFSEDGVLYRARVLALQGSRVRLLFIDFGNCEEVEVASLVELPPCLRGVPGRSSLYLVYYAALEYQIQVGTL